MADACSTDMIFFFSELRAYWPRGFVLDLDFSSLRSWFDVGRIGKHPRYDKRDSILFGGFGLDCCEICCEKFG